MMIDENVPVEIMHTVRAEDFYYRSHESIYRAMNRIWNDNRPIDLVTVTQELDGMGLLASVGGAQYISALSGFIASTANYKAHADIIKKNSQLRQLMAAANEILKKCYASEDSLETLQYAEKVISDVAEQQGVSALMPFEDADLPHHALLQRQLCVAGGRCHLVALASCKSIVYLPNSCGAFGYHAGASRTFA